MSSIIKGIKSIGKRFISGLNMANAKRFLDTCAEVIKNVEAVSPQLIKLSPKLESVLGSQKFKDIFKEFVSQTIF